MFEDAHRALGEARANYRKALGALALTLRSEFPRWASHAAARIAAAQRDVTDSKSDIELAEVKTSVEGAAGRSVERVDSTLQEAFDANAYEMERLPADLDAVQRELRVLLASLTGGVFSALQRAGYQLEGDGLLPAGAIEPDHAFEEQAIVFYQAAANLRQQRRIWASELAAESVEERWERL